MPSPKSIDFDNVSYHYEEVLDEPLKLRLGGEPSDYYLLLKARELLDHCRRRGLEPASAALLDVGCGTGRMLEVLRPEVRSVAGVEPSRGMLERAKKLLGGAALQQGIAEALPFEDGRFDVVTSACIFHHSAREKFGPMMREMARVLKPGGLLFAFEHNPWNPMTQWVVARCPVDEGVTLVRPEEIRRAYGAAGLARPETRFIVFFPRALSALRPWEPGLHRIPLGGQYYLCARKP